MESAELYRDTVASSDEDSIEGGYNIEGDESDEDHVSADDKLDISKILADGNYDAAGTEVDEVKDGICIDDHRELIVPEVNSKLDDIVSKLKMPYLPTDFQRLSINALGQQKNVVLVSPTGSGKMNVPLLATLVLREQLGIPKGKYSYFPSKFI